MCSHPHEDFWRRMSERLDAPSGDPPEVVQIAREHVRIRAQMCARREALTVAPRQHTLTGAEADRSISDCPR